MNIIYSSIIVLNQYFLGNFTFISKIVFSSADFVTVP